MVPTVLAPPVAQEANVLPQERKQTSGYFVGPVYDWIFFLLAPLYALAVGVLLSGTYLDEREFSFHGDSTTLVSLGIGILIHAHIFAVVFRSYGNQTVFRRYRWRFLLVPPLLYAAMISSTWVLITAAVLATFWDVYHSGLQTFGFARIYEAKAGNNPSVGRRLDLILNHLLYAGPIVAGATMIDHFDSFEQFDQVGSMILTTVPAFMEGNQSYFTWSIVIGGSLFLLYYCLAYWRLHKRGHQVSVPKVVLLVSTGFCSIYTWGFNSFGMAFFIMNFFHATQYFGIVWASERKSMMRVFSLEGVSWKKPLALGLFALSTFSYGYFVEAADTGIHWLWAITLVVSLMHFWYDGFIWSVRKEHV